MAPIIWISDYPDSLDVPQVKWLNEHTRGTLSTVNILKIFIYLSIAINLLIRTIGLPRNSYPMGVGVGDKYETCCKSTMQNNRQASYTIKNNAHTCYHDFYKFGYQ